MIGHEQHRHPISWQALFFSTLISSGAVAPKVECNDYVGNTSYTAVGLLNNFTCLRTPFTNIVVAAPVVKLWFMSLTTV
jgi:hypothetical protein